MAKGQPFAFLTGSILVGESNPRHFPADDSDSPNLLLEEEIQWKMRSK
jgi:hypothetical protein